MQHEITQSSMPEEALQTVPQLVDEVRAGKMPRRNFMRALAALGLSAAGASAISASAAEPASTAKQSTPTPPPDDQPVQNLDLHEKHLAHQMQGNTGALQHDYAEHAVVEDSMYSEPFVGKAAIMARKGIGMAAIPDLKIAVTNRIAHGPQVLVEWTATGTHTGDFPGVPASGRPFSIRGVTVVVRHEGKIVREAIYYDMQEVRRQLS
jgi:steroid delta-isomerase-like uncharacterized protein